MAVSGRVTNLLSLCAAELEPLGYVDLFAVNGWETRGGYLNNASVGVGHWTATPRSGTAQRLPSLGIVTNGLYRPDLGYRLNGPLYNVLADHDFGQDKIKVAVVAAGTSNNAGRGSWKGVTGNSRTIAWCFDTPGTPGFEWTQRMLAIAAALNTACLKAIKETDVSRSCGHYEWTSRKIDPKPYMPGIRANSFKTPATVEGYEVLKKGDEGNEIVVLQWNLNTIINGDPVHPKGIPVDGKFGDWTENAVKLLQNRYGYKATGVYDLPLSERVMRELLK